MLSTMTRGRALAAKLHSQCWRGRFRELRSPRLQSGKAEYKSVTVSIDATAEEFTDFYLDDDVRPEWVRCSLHTSRHYADAQILALQSWQLLLGACILCSHTP